MQTQKIKNVVASFLFFFLSAHAQNFEFWNKHIQPVYYSVTQSTNDASKAKLQELRPGKWITNTINLSKPTIITLSVGKMPEKGQRLDTFTLKEGKNLFIRIGLPAEKEKFKETIKSVLGRSSLEGDNYIFGAQVGPLLGFKSTTERGYSLDNNIKNSEITKGSVIYLPD